MPKKLAALVAVRYQFYSGASHAVSKNVAALVAALSVTVIFYNNNNNNNNIP